MTEQNTLNIQLKTGWPLGAPTPLFESAPHLIPLGKANASNAIQIFETTAKSLLAWQDELVEFAHMRLEKDLHTARKMLNAKDMDEVVQLQGEHTRALVRDYLQGTQRLMERSFRVIQENVPPLSESATRMAGEMRQTAEDMTRGVQEITHRIASEVQETTKQVTDAVREGSERVAGQAQETARRVADELQEDARRATDEAREKTARAVDVAQETTDQAAGAMRKGAEQTVDAAQQVARGAVDAAQEGAEHAAGTEQEDTEVHRRRGSKKG